MEIVKVTQSIIDNFQMSKEDLNEEKASGNTYDFSTIEDSVAVKDGDTILCLGGITSFHTIWLLCTDDVKQLKVNKKKQFVKTIWKIVQGFLDDNPDVEYFYNTVWSGNEDHIKFIESCGGIIEYSKGFQTVTGEAFYPFTIRR